MVLLGVYFHEMFMKTVVERRLPPKSQGAPLSVQEKHASGGLSRNCAPRDREAPASLGR